MASEYVNVFGKYQAQAWPIAYAGTLHVRTLCGGTPSDEKTAEAWIRSKVYDTRSESEVQKLVASVMAELEVTLDEAVRKAAGDMAGLNIFKRTAEGVLYIEGRHLKAALKEAVSVAANEGKISTKQWGTPDDRRYLKSLKGWFPEHVFVAEERLPLSRDGELLTEPSGTLQKFVHTHRGDALSYEEFCEDVDVEFTIETDHEFSEKEWAMIWLTGGPQGIGSSRSQGYGRYEVTRWDRLR